MMRIRRGTVVGIVATVLPLVIAALVAKGLFPGAGERLVTLFLINVIAVIGINDATETTDYLMPTGILRRADVADVMLVSTRAGPVKLYPALTVEADATIAEFDTQHPDGADFVIVPAMSRNDDPAAIQWIRDQSA